MFEKWYELNQKWKFLSQFAMFFIAVFAMLSLGYLVRAVSFNQDSLLFQKNQILISGMFHLIIAVLFTFRFILLFFNTKKIFIISQIVWVICILILIAFHLFTRFALYGGLFPPETKISFGMDNYPILFLYAENSFIVLMFIYVVVSPIRQFLTLLISKISK